LLIERIDRTQLLLVLIPYSDQFIHGGDTVFLLERIKGMVKMIIPWGMPNTRFRVDILPRKEPESDGMDDIRFMFSANKSAELQPVALAKTCIFVPSSCMISPILSAISPDTPVSTSSKIIVGKRPYADPYQAIRGGGTCERGGPYVERSLVDRGFSCQCERFVGYQGLNLSEVGQS